MKKLNRLIDECKSQELNVSITYQRINGYSVEIYTGYLKTYKKYYYSDGGSSLKKEVKKAYKYFKNK